MHTNRIQGLKRKTRKLSKEKKVLEEQVAAAEKEFNSRKR